MLDENKIIEVLDYLNQTAQQLRVNGFDYTYSFEIKYSFYADSKRTRRLYLVNKWNGSKLYGKTKISYPIVDSLNIFANEEIANLEEINRKAVAEICKKKHLKQRDEKRKEKQQTIES